MAEHTLGMCQHLGTVHKVTALYVSVFFHVWRVSCLYACLHVHIKAMYMSVEDWRWQPHCEELALI